jgi:ATP-dependent helicase/nuclease subunit A
MQGDGSCDYAQDDVFTGSARHSARSEAESQNPQSLIDVVQPRIYFIEDSDQAAAEDEGMLSESVRSREPGGLNAAERGTALHTVFEHLNYAEIKVGEVDGDYITNYLNRLVQDGFITATERSAVGVEVLQRYVGTEIFARAKTADAKGTLRRETPFTLRHKLKSKITDREEEVIVQGIIDLWFTEGDDIVLVDYKSGYRSLGSAVGEAKIKEKYSLQINLYKEALTKITGKKVKETFLYMTDTGITIPV